MPPHERIHVGPSAHVLNCNHNTLSATSSRHARINRVGYHVRSRSEIRDVLSITSANKKAKRSANASDVTENDIDNAIAYPAPLVLPEDDLAYESGDEEHPVHEWKAMHDHHQRGNSSRKTIYVAAAPKVDRTVKYVNDWVVPQLDTSGQAAKNVEAPAVNDVIKYLEAFYHGLPVKPLPYPLTFAHWDEDTEDPAAESYIALNSPVTSVRVRTRPCPDKLYLRQLNLNDILDTVIESLPRDAYALLLLTRHDVYEDEEDDFACGRAYGGSRVAVVSTARYDPRLDELQRVNRVHAWPASHCSSYMERCCDEAEKAPSRFKMAEGKGPAKQVTSKQWIGGKQFAPLEAAVDAHSKALLALGGEERAEKKRAMSGLWLGRVCRTASHELCHCCLLDHCVFFACNMQACATIIEDARQPPYLCAIDLKKVLMVTGAEAKERDEKLLAVCQSWQGVAFFEAYAAWLRKALGI